MLQHQHASFIECNNQHTKSKSPKRVGPGKKKYNLWKTNLMVSPPLTPGKKNNTLEKKFKHSTWTWLEGRCIRKTCYVIRSQFIEFLGPEDQSTTRPQDQRTTGPNDHRTRGPEDQRTRGPQDQRTIGPEEHRTRGPNNQRTKGPQGQRSLNFFSRGCKYFFQGTWFFFQGT